MMRRLEHLSYKGLFSLEKRRMRGNLINVYKYLKGRGQEDGSGLFHFTFQDHIYHFCCILLQKTDDTLLLENSNCDSDAWNSLKIFYGMIDCPSFAICDFQRCCYCYTVTASKIFYSPHVFRFFSFLCEKPNDIYFLQVLFWCWNWFVFSLIMGWRIFSLEFQRL